MVTDSEKKPDRADDIQLWHRILDGDRCALSQLFNKYYSPLLNYGLNILSREDLVKDSIQEMFFTIWKGREELSDIKYVRSYLYSSFRRAVFRQAEIKNNRDSRDESYAEESFREILNREELMIKEELRQEQKRELLKAVRELTKRQKEAFFLKFQEGLSNEEIAQVMDVNKQSVYNYIHRAVVALQDYLDGGHEFGDVKTNDNSFSFTSLSTVSSILFTLFFS